MATSREYIGKYLQDNYSGADRQDVHIDEFVIVVSHPHALKLPSLINFDDYKGCDGVWKTPEDWPGAYFGTFLKIGNESERQRENRLNLELGKIVKVEAKKYVGDSEVSVMLHRACKYTQVPEPVPTIPVTAEEIGAILKEDCGMVYHYTEESHINYFFMKIEIEKECPWPGIASLLKHKPGNWRKVTPEKKWPNTFFGYFPKNSTKETEREREERLNIEVRIPFKKELKEKTNGSVHIFLMRACKYT